MKTSNDLGDAYFSTSPRSFDDFIRGNSIHDFCHWEILQNTQRKHGTNHHDILRDGECYRNTAREWCILCHGEYQFLLLQSNYPSRLDSRKQLKIESSAQK